MTWVAVAVAGALGAVARFIVDHTVTDRVRSLLPIGTAVVNVTGSFAAGVIAALALRSSASDVVVTVAAGGFLGAYTTFSTAMYQTARLLEQGAIARGVTNLAGPLVASIAAAAAGLRVAS